MRQIKLKRKRQIGYYFYLQSEHWKDLRKEIIEFRGPQCEKCGEWLDGLEENLNLHHIVYRNRYQEKWEDLVLLCYGCHEREHDKQNPMPIKDYNQFVDPC